MFLLDFIHFSIQFLVIFRLFAIQEPHQVANLKKKNMIY